MNSPSFSEREKLARYVGSDHIKRGGRVSSAAFKPRENMDKYLSVNSLEIESLNEIAKYYQRIMKQGGNPINITSLSIKQYNEAASGSGIPIDYDYKENVWKFQSPGGLRVAYKHRPGSSISHCGVEYIDYRMNEIIMNKIARELAFISKSDLISPSRKN